jgi:hypothetical protein
MGPNGRRRYTVVVLAHHRIRLGATRLPDRAAVEAAQPAQPGRHVGEPANPDEPVRLVHDRELPQHVHALVPLREEEVLLEIADEVAGPTGLEKVVAELDDHAASSPRGS